MSSLPPEIEKQVQDAIRRTDSLRDVPMPLLTPQQIRAAGTSGAQQAPNLFLPWLSTLITRRSLVTGAAAALTVVAVGIGARTLLIAEPGIAAPAPLPINARGERARDHLLELATTLANQPPAPSSTAPVATHTRLQRWSIDTTNYSGSTIIAHDEQAWRYPDRSGYTIQTTLPAQPAQQQTAQYINQLDPAWPQRREDYSPGTFPTIIDDASSTTDEIATELARHQPDSGPVGVLRGVADINEAHHLRLAQRIAVLRLLAVTPDITWRGKTLDRASRECVAISLDSGDAHTGMLRDILLIAPNGLVYGHEQVSLEPPSQSKGIPPGTVIAYTLYLITEHLPT